MEDRYTIDLASIYLNRISPLLTPSSVTEVLAKAIVWLCRCWELAASFPARTAVSVRDDGGVEDGELWGKTRRPRQMSETNIISLSVCEITPWFTDISPVPVTESQAAHHQSEHDSAPRCRTCRRQARAAARATRKGQQSWDNMRWQGDSPAGRPDEHRPWLLCTQTSFARCVRLAESGVDKVLTRSRTSRGVEGSLLVDIDGL